MTSDADRFRPRDAHSIAEQSPPAQPEPSGRAHGSAPQAPDTRAPAPYGSAQRASTPYGSAPHASPYGSASRASAPYGSAPRASAPYGSHASAPYGSPPYAGPRSAFPPQQSSFDGRDAPLIHPAAAQASRAVAYGVPVYRAPVYGPPPQQARGLSITALVLGICSFIFAWTLIVVPIIGIVFSSIALRREPAGRSMAVAGLITSALGLLWVLVFYVVPFGAFFSAMLLGGFLV